MNTERRSAPRENIDSLVYLNLHPDNGGILLNLNANGMLVSVAHPLTAVKAMRFSFGLSSPSKIEGTGRIVWISKSGRSAGICFEDLSESSLDQISQWLKTLSSPTVSEPSEDSHGATHVMETQIGVGEAEPVDSATMLPVSDQFAEFAAASCPSDDAENGSAQTSDKPSVPTDGVFVAPETELRETTARSQSAWANEVPEPPLATGVPETEQSSETEKVAVAQNSAEEEFKWIHPAPLDTAHPVSNVDLAGLNEPLPVYTMPVGRPCPTTSTPSSASGDILDLFREIGWGLERDWHVGLGALLFVGGFAAYSRHPSSLMLAMALWVGCAVVVANRKRPPENWKQPSDSRNGRSHSTG